MCQVIIDCQNVSLDSETAFAVSTNFFAKSLNSCVQCLSTDDVGDVTFATGQLASSFPHSKRFERQRIVFCLPDLFMIPEEYDVKSDWFMIASF